MVNVFPVPNGPSNRTGGMEILSGAVIAANALFCSTLSRENLKLTASLPNRSKKLISFISMWILLRNTNPISGKLSTVLCHSQKGSRFNKNCTCTWRSVLATKFNVCTHSFDNLTYTVCVHLSSMCASNIMFVARDKFLKSTLLQPLRNSLPLFVSSEILRLSGSCDKNSSYIIFFKNQKLETILILLILEHIYFYCVCVCMCVCMYVCMYV